MIVLKACPKCGGDMYPEEDDYKAIYYKCIQCSKMITKDEMENIMLEKKNTPPPKPDITGMNIYQRNFTLQKYYEDNKESIVHDLETIGEKAMKKKWGLGVSSWKVIRWRWMPDRYEKPPWYGQKKKKDIKPIDKAQAVDKSSGREVKLNVCPECKELVTSDGVGHKNKCSLRPKPDTQPEKKNNGYQLPAFPEFNEQWVTEVKVKWLDTYAVLARR